MNNVAISICFIFLLHSCINKNGHEIPDDRIEVVKDGEGNLKYEIGYINDTLEHGIAKYYYHSTNVLKDEITYQYGKKEGWHKHYRPDGTLESAVYFVDNQQDGITYWYYEDGKSVKSKSYWKMGKSYGSAFFYYSNGNLRLFNTTDAFGETFFVIKWDSLGSEIYNDGMVFSSQFLSNISASEINTKETLSLDITVAQPPNMTSKILMNELGRELQELTIKNYTATYEDTFTTAGKHTLVTVGEIKDLEGNIIKRDSITTEINVIE